MKNKEFTIGDQAMLEDIMLHRRDIRGNNFLSKKIPCEILDKIIYSASLAPSVGFSQPWEFVVVRDESIKKRIYENHLVENQKAADYFKGDKKESYNSLKLDGIIESPINIAVFYRPSVGPVLGQNTMQETGEYSVVCAIQNMWLMSRALNIGLGWVSIINPDFVKKILKSPVENKLVAYLCLGYVKEFYTVPELEKINWKKRRGLESIVHDDFYSPC